ncbi:MAG: FAD-binding protein [Actinobacteria bacterium]|nr:FAD-binding protein [Actinomycetota bacterium]
MREVIPTALGDRPAVQRADDRELVGDLRLLREVEVDPVSMTASLGPGLLGPEVETSLRARGFTLGHFPQSFEHSTLGGWIATRAGGHFATNYTHIDDFVESLRVVTPTGVVETRRLPGSGAGPSPDRLFLGSEGTLGITTEVTVRLMRTPEAVRTLLAGFRSTDDAGAAVSSIIAAGILPAAIEMMDALTIQAAEQAVGAGFPTDADAALIVELDGSLAECNACFDDVVAICERNGATSIRIAEDDVERALIWRTRKAAFAAMGRLAPNYFVQDGVIPRTKLPEVLARIGALADEYGMRVANVFHAGDGNLHPLVLYDGEAQAERAEELSGKIVEACVDAGGSITGEHGVGVDKKRYMPSMFDEAALAAFQHLRCAFDPRGLANPGKVMPTPRLCGEVPGPYRQHPLERDGIAERF